VLVLALEVMNTEAQPLGMSINWSKTKVQDLGGCGAPCQRVCQCSRERSGGRIAMTTKNPKTL